MMAIEDQFIRRCGLYVYTEASPGGQPSSVIDLSQFRITFHVQAADVQSPNSAAIRVYNVDPVTIGQIQGEFQKVVLNAGYEQGAYGSIFRGTIRQVKIGRESNVDTYLEILANDSDIEYNGSIISLSFTSGYTPAQVINDTAEAMGLPVNPNTNPNDIFGGTVPNARGKVVFGMARDAIRAEAARLQSTWSIQNGTIQVIPYNKYLPGDPVVLSEMTGVVGIPEATDEGIKVKVLLNPKLTVGGTAQIANALINQLIQVQGSLNIPYNQRTGLQFIANTSRDGLYRIWVIEYEGDTRGRPWYATLTCLAVDPSTQTVIQQQD